ncbi:MAG: CAP domain-containing protein [Syntrophobacteraceae bacterium]|jgi:uncharacterized protein YkwD
MKRNSHIFILIGIGCCLVGCLRKALPPDVPPEPRLAKLEMSVFAEINQQRRNNGLRDLIWREDIARVARLHSSNMGGREFFSHEDPVEGDLKQRLTKFGVNDWASAGENIFKESGVYNPARQAVEGWMNSPGHRKNILNPAFTHTGIGAAFGHDHFLYFTQDFILPK